MTFMGGGVEELVSAITFSYTDKQDRYIFFLVGKPCMIQNVLSKIFSIAIERCRN